MRLALRRCTWFWQLRPSASSLASLADIVTALSLSHYERSKSSGLLWQKSSRPLVVEFANFIITQFRNCAKPQRAAACPRARATLSPPREHALSGGITNPAQVSTDSDCSLARGLANLRAVTKSTVTIWAKFFNKKVGRLGGMYVSFDTPLRACLSPSRPVPIPRFAPTEHLL